MAGMPWFRVYSEILDDKKIKRICRATEFNKAVVIGTWICLLSLANESDDRGKLLISENMPYDINDMVCETELPEDDLKKLISLFEKYDMLENVNGCYEIKNWDGRQFKSDNSSERVAKHREKKRNEQNDMKRYSNVIDTDSDTEQNIVDIEEDYITAFCQITGIGYPFKVSTHAKWIEEVGEWVDLKISREDIQNAYKIAIEKKYTVARPGGLTSFLRGNIAKSNAPGAKTNEQIIKEMIDNGEL